MKPKKLNSIELLDAIIKVVSDDIRKKFAKTSLWSNNSLGYYGVKYDCKFTIDVYSKQGKPQPTDHTEINYTTVALEGEFNETELPVPTKIEVDESHSAGSARK